MTEIDLGIFVSQENDRNNSSLCVVFLNEFLGWIFNLFCHRSLPAEKRLFFCWLVKISFANNVGLEAINLGQFYALFAGQRGGGLRAVTGKERKKIYVYKKYLAILNKGTESITAY